LIKKNIENNTPLEITKSQFNSMLGATSAEPRYAKSEPKSVADEANPIMLPILSGSAIFPRKEYKRGTKPAIEIPITILKGKIRR
jgi:hypothetical protein